MGPFVDVQNEDINDGNISYRGSDNQLEFMEYNELFLKIQEYINGEIAQNKIKTQIVIVPSSREIQHLYPLP